LGTYKYNGLSRRTSKSVEGRKRFFVYGSHFDPLGEYDATGAALREYAYVGTLRVAFADHDRDSDAVRDEGDNCSAVGNPAQSDADSDLLGDACDSAPGNPDRDGDGLSDGQEDADHDAFLDATETDPNLADTDGDSFSDGEEVGAGSDPLNPNSTPNNIPTLAGPAAATLVVLFLVLGGWRARRRWPKETRVGLLVLAAGGACLIAPDRLRSQGGSSEKILYIHTDHLGTPLLLTDVSQQVVWRATAEPFGKTTPSINQVTFNLRFPGQYEDEETGLSYNYFRTYAPSTGRYLEPDPIGLMGGINRYEFVAGNPLIAVDPSGLLTAGVPNPLYATPLAAQAWYRSLVGPSVFQFSIPAGEGYGEYAAQYYAGVLGDPCASSWARGGAWAGGLLSSLWTRNTSDLTFLALSSAYGGAKAFGAARGIGYGPLNPGPLADDIAATFRSGSYTARTLDQPTSLWRVIGDKGNPTGSFWTATEPRSPLQSAIDLGLDQSWGNTATQVIRAEVPAGTTIYEGAAAAQRGLVGGGSQVYIPRVDPRWLR